MTVFLLCSGYLLMALGFWLQLHRRSMAAVLLLLASGWVPVALVLPGTKGIFTGLAIMSLAGLSVTLYNGTKQPKL